MKIISYKHGGQAIYGAVVGDGVVDLAKRLEYADLKALLEADGLAEAAKAVADAGGAAPDAMLAEIEYLPLIAKPGKIICVGLNYKAHREETGRKPTDNPALFVRFPESQTAHLGPLVRPKASSMLDFEGELAVIIGKPGRLVKNADALSIIAGYSCYNDGSIRDWQNHTMQWTAGKNFMQTGAFGPWLVTTDEIPDPAALELTTRLNGQVMQNSTTDLLIWDIPTLIEYITTFTALAPGDVISTGTPGGVGFKRDPQVFMKPGDTIEVEITGIGILKNEIVGE